MTLHEWKTFEPLLRQVGIKPYVVESKNGLGEVFGYVVRLTADNVKFSVEVMRREFEKPEVEKKRGRPMYKQITNLFGGTK